MPIKAIAIVVDRQTRSFTPGGHRAQDIINLADLGPGEQLLLEVPGDVDIPLAPDDWLVIRGGEQFSIHAGGTAIEDNPPMRKPSAATLNDQQLPNQHAPYHAKRTGQELKRLAGVASNDDLWVDLDGLADEPIDDDTRVILQSADKYFSVERGPDDRAYTVKVLLDDEEREMTFPARWSVEHAIRHSLPPRDRPSAGEFQMVDANLGTQPLTNSQTLQAAGVRDGHLLSITKSNGGGG